MLTIEELLNYDYGYLQKYIVKLPDSDYKKSILTDTRIRELFLNNPEAHYPFVYLVQELDEETLPYLVDRDLILKLKGKEDIKDRREFKFNAIMTCAKPIVNELLIDDNFFEYILNSHENRSNLDSLNSTFGKAFINYVIDHYPRHIDLISKFRDNVQDEILDEGIINKIFNAGIKLDFISSLSLSPLSRICKDPRFTNIISNMDIRSIDMMVFNGVTFSKDLQDSRIIVDKYLVIDNIDDYRSMVDRLALNNSNLYEHIKRKKNIITDRLVSSITPDMEILPMFDEEQLMNSDNYSAINEFYRDTRGMSSEEIEEYKKLKSKQYVFKLLSDRYFEENGYNLQVNLIEMFKYMGDFNPELMSEESYNLYSRLLNYKGSSLYELSELYKGLNKNKKYVNKISNSMDRCNLEYSKGLYKSR